MMPPVTDKQRRALLFVRDYIREHGWPPSDAEIRRNCHVTSVRQMFILLDKKNYVEYQGSRQVRVLCTP